MQFRANYTDNTFYEWDENTPSDKAYLQIDRTKLASIELYLRGRLLHKLHLEKGQRLILRRRVRMSMSGKSLQEIYLVGYQETIADQKINRQAITAIFTDDFHTELIGSWKKHPLDAVNLIEAEKEEEEEKRP